MDKDISVMLDIKRSYNLNNFLCELNARNVEKQIINFW